MRLIAYIRVSTDDQAKTGHSLDTVQPQRLAAYCALHGHALVDTISDDGVSASVPLAKRAGGRALLAKLKAGEADGVAVVRLDRLFRDALDGLLFFQQFVDKRNVAVHSVSELIDSSSPAGRLNLTIQLAAAQYERDLAVQRAVDNSRGLRKAGRKYGHAPFGCVAHGGSLGEGGKRIDQKLYRDPATWPTRLRIVALREQGKSLGEIRTWLRQARIPAPTGGEFWSKSTLAAICELHGELTHLPELPKHAAAALRAAPETGVSHARPH